MLERKHRLRGEELFRQVFSKGKRVFLGAITGFSLPIKDDTLVIGVTFKQKAFPRSVTRHAYKRRTLAWVRQHFGEIPQGRAIVIHFQQPLAHPSSQVLHQALANLFHSLKNL